MAPLFRTILVPHDFSPAATAALELAATLAARHGGRLIVLHAMTPVYPLTSFGQDTGLPVWAPPKELIVETRQRLQALVARTLRGRRVRSVTCRILIGDPYRCIVEAARRADSIVMPTLGRGGLAHLLIGSVAEKVVRHAPVPVLTVRAPLARAFRVRRTHGQAGAARSVRAGGKRAPR